MGLGDSQCTLRSTLCNEYVNINVYKLIVPLTLLRSQLSQRGELRNGFGVLGVSKSNTNRIDVFNSCLATSHEVKSQ